MIILDDQHLLFIEPKLPKEAVPIDDKFTKIMLLAYQYSEKIDRTRGWHTCSCGEWSSNCSYKLPNGLITNSLCVHYLMWHRSEVPELELKKVLTL